MEVSEKTVIVWRLGALVGPEAIRQIGLVEVVLSGRRAPLQADARRLEVIYRSVRRVANYFSEGDAAGNPVAGHAFILAKLAASNRQPLCRAIKKADHVELPFLMASAAEEFIAHRGVEHWRLGA